MVNSSTDPVDSDSDTLGIFGDQPDEAQAAVVNGDVRFVTRDAELLTAIAELGSMNRAARELERSQARASRRIVELESAFGPLVDRRRGGPGGGGSDLTDHGRAILDRYRRLEAAMDATARLHETVLRGEIVSINGELATGTTDIGRVRGIHDGLLVGDTVQIRIPSDALTVHDPSHTPRPNATSARNQRAGRIRSIESGDAIDILHMHVDGVTFQATVTHESMDRLSLNVDDPIVLTWKATATRLIASMRRTKH